MKGHLSEETVDLRDRKWIQSAQRGAVAAANEPDSSEAAVALEKLCRAYWYPLYALVRRRGHSVEEAQDLTQGFFLHMLEKHRLAGIDPSRGKFRSFLINAFNHFLANEWRREHAAKRGAGNPLISLDSGAADYRYSLETGSNVTPEVLYERQWAIALLESALRRLEAEFAAAGKSKHFERLKGLLTTEPERHQYGAAAIDLGMTIGAVRVAICRLRHRYRALVREEIAQTVETPAEVDEEIRWLHTVLG